MFKLFSCQLCQIGKVQHANLCADCWQQLPWLKSTVQRQDIDIMVACRYDYPLDRMIQQFKYQQKLHYQAVLAALLSQLSYPKIQAIVAMPISTTRLAERGYNQAMLLAQHLAQQLNVPIWQPITRLEQHSQKGLSRHERLSQIQQQFQPNPLHTKICYRKVLIVDDVVTTGASIQALAQQLKNLGCEQVYACCLAAATL